MHFQVKLRSQSQERTMSVCPEKKKIPENSMCCIQGKFFGHCFTFKTSKCKSEIKITRDKNISDKHIVQYLILHLN